MSIHEKRIEQLTTENDELKAKVRRLLEEKQQQLQILQKEKAQVLEQIRMAEGELASLRESAATFEGELKRGVVPA